MAIVHMKKLRLMVVRRQKDELLRDLMLLGCVQISEPDALLADAESAAVLRQESGNVTEVRSELTRLTAALKLLDKYAPVKSRLLSSRPEVTEADFLDDGAYRQELDAVAQLEELEAAVRRYNGEEAKLRSNMEALRPWQTLDLPLDLGETVRTRISLGMLPAAVDLAEAAKALADAAPESQLYEISSDKEQHYVLLICLKEELTEAITALRASGFTLANLNGAPGTAKQNIEDAQQQIADVIRRREQAETDIAAFAPHRDAFKLCIDRASVKLGRAEAEERLVGTESVVCMRGWLTAPEEEKLTAVLAKYDCAWDLADPTEDGHVSISGPQPICAKSRALSEGLTDAAALAGELEEPPVVHDAVDDRCGEFVVREDRAPFTELDVRGEYDAPSFVAARDDLVEQARPVDVEGYVAELVQYDQVGTADVPEHRLERAVAFGPAQLEDELGGLMEPHAQPHVDRLHAQPDREMCLSAPGLAVEHQVLRARDETEP